MRSPASEQHAAWKVLGPRCKAVYTQVAENRFNVPLAAIAAAGLTSSRGYEALAKLAAAGLINRAPGYVEVGPVSLDDFATNPPSAPESITSVHDAWRILGRSCRLVHQQVVDHGMTTPIDIFATIGIGSTAGYRALTRLADVGLVQRGWRTVQPGPVSLDEFVREQGSPVRMALNGR